MFYEIETGRDSLRWFQDVEDFNSMHLWLHGKDVYSKFELEYDEVFLIFNKGNYSFYGVGDESGGDVVYKGTPLLLKIDTFPKERFVDKFERASVSLPPYIRTWITIALRDFPGPTSAETAMESLEARAAKERIRGSTKELNESEKQAANQAPVAKVRGEIEPTLAKIILENVESKLRTRGNLRATGGSLCPYCNSAKTVLVRNPELPIIYYCTSCEKAYVL